MKWVVAILLMLLLTLQYRLWFGDGSIQEVWRLTEESRAARAELLRLRGRNQALSAEVRDLKSGLEAIEERARADLGMIGEGETFYRFVRERGAAINEAELDIEGGPAPIRDALGDPSGQPAGQAADPNVAPTDG